MDTTWILWFADSRTEETLSYIEGLQRYGERGWRKILGGGDDNVFARRA